MMNLTFFLIFPVQTIEHNVASNEEIPEIDSEDLLKEDTNRTGHAVEYEDEIEGAPESRQIKECLPSHHDKPSTADSMRKSPFGFEVKGNSRVSVASDVSDANSLIQKRFAYISNDGTANAKTKVNSSKGSFSHPVSLAGKGVPNSNFEKSKSHNSKKMLTSTAASAVAKSEKKNESPTNAAHQNGPKRIAAVQANQNPKR